MSHGCETFSVAMLSSDALTDTPAFVALLLALRKNAPTDASIASCGTPMNPK